MIYWESDRGYKFSSVSDVINGVLMYMDMCKPSQNFDIETGNGGLMMLQKMAKEHVEYELRKEELHIGNVLCKIHYERTLDELGPISSKFKGFPLTSYGFKITLSDNTIFYLKASLRI